MYFSLPKVFLFILIQVICYISFSMKHQVKDWKIGTCCFPG